MAAEHETFWTWFSDHEDELHSFDCHDESAREKIFDQLASAMQSVHPNLTFEFGPNETKREFVISAAGIRSAFSAVIDLVKAAPPLDRWQIIPFRPRRSPVSTVQINDKWVDPKNVEFTLLDNGVNAGIYLFLPGFKNDDSDLRQIGYLLLDEALGEYDVETKLGLIKILAPETSAQGNRYPLSQLPASFDRLVARLEGRTQKPF